jgi:hypothetical protein
MSPRCPEPLMPLRAAAALVTALCLCGCELFAEIPDRTLAPAGDDACPAGGVWPDSPTTLCSDGTAVIDCKSPFATGQDGSYLMHPPGYSYIASATRYSVLDSVTGLMWEDTASAVVQWGAAEAYCTSLGVGWRLPSRLELLSILDYGRTEPATDPHFFFSSGVGDFCASKSLTPDGAGVWGFDFSQGAGSLVDRTAATVRVRCVLGTEAQACLAPSHDGLAVRDSRTGLTWLRRPPEELFTWPGALDYCESLDEAGFDDWRLPSVKELQSLVDDGRIFPAIDVEVFPGTSGVFWSSSPSAASPGDAWSVDFDLGRNMTETAVIKRQARCTR